MQVDFFHSLCLTKITAKKVGISDADSNKESPAFVLLSDEDNWDFMVSNPNEKEIEFGAIDYCIDIFRTSVYTLGDDNRDPLVFSSSSVGLEPIKRCEGFLFKEDEFIVFFEIKTGVYGSWLKDARGKFEETILSFKEHHPKMIDLIKNPIVSNKAYKKRIHQNLMIQNKILKDKTGLNIRLVISTNYDVA